MLGLAIVIDSLKVSTRPTAAQAHQTHPRGTHHGLGPRSARGGRDPESQLQHQGRGPVKMADYGNSNNDLASTGIGVHVQWSHTLV